MTSAISTLGSELEVHSKVPAASLFRPLDLLRPGDDATILEQALRGVGCLVSNTSIHKGEQAYLVRCDGMAHLVHAHYPLNPDWILITDPTHRDLIEALEVETLWSPITMVQGPRKRPR